MPASAAAKFCSQQERSELYQLSPENEISKQDQLQNAAPPFSFLILYQISLLHFKNRRTRSLLHMMGSLFEISIPINQNEMIWKIQDYKSLSLPPTSSKNEESTCLAVRSSRHCSFKINRSSCTFFILDTNFIGFAYRQH